ncbi:hypothetical protein Ddye_011764 [Dipteronia dyeriana]|uniref:Uncharacterized protein n=1 Tax=Dipteronia dyeriana TaxID=168575 RepID=A0AAD9X396_9ROSI|nr:hypothetical protein Ddye_011764 [Dipteronia dyeriana]
MYGTVATVHGIRKPFTILCGTVHRRVMWLGIVVECSWVRDTIHSIIRHCSQGSRVVPSRQYVSLRPHGGNEVNGWADPLVGSSLLSVGGSLPIGKAIMVG